MKSLCVYCGAGSGGNSAYGKAAGVLGKEIARRGIRLVYGGGAKGLMGTVADGALEAGGEVTGVIPRSLVDRELAHTSLTRLEVVSSMGERKAMMMELSEAFIALPGGIGTLEEIVEVMSWSQLGVHEKPFGVLNTLGYYDRFFAFLDHMAGEELLPQRSRQALKSSPDPVILLDELGKPYSSFKRWDP